MDASLDKRLTGFTTPAEGSIPTLSRRSALKLALITTVAGFIPSAINTTATINTAANAAKARQMPANNESFLEMARNFLELDDLQDIYDEHIKELADPIDGKPLISLDTFTLIMPWVQAIARIQYEQRNDSDRPTFKEFVNDFIKTTCEISQEVGLRPEVFLMSYVISGQNVNSNNFQQLDVQVYKAQIATNMVERTFGSQGLKTVQQQLSDDSSYVFTDYGKRNIESLSTLLGLDINLDKTFSPTRPWAVSRMGNLTLGSMDIEPVVYAEGVEFMLEKYPKASIYLKEFPEASVALQRLAEEKALLEKSRERLKTAAIDFVNAHPDVIDDFLNPETAEAAFDEIGIGTDGEVNFSYSFDSNKGYSYDRKIMMNGNNKRDLSDPKRKIFVANETIKHFTDLAVQDKKSAGEALMADQIFNDKFINYLEKRINIFATSPLRSALRDFDKSSNQFKEVRLSSYAPLAKLEYDTKFQLTLAIATTRMLLEDVKIAFPELKLENRNAYYWQMYLVSMIREMSGQPSLFSQYLRPDVDPPYNNPHFLAAFMEYYEMYVSLGLVDKNSFPRDFENFFLAEFNYLQMQKNSQSTAVGLTKDQYNSLSDQEKVFAGEIFSGWMRTHEIGSLLGLLRI